MRLEHHLVGGYVRYISPHYYYIIRTYVDTPVIVYKHYTSAAKGLNIASLDS